MAQTLTTTKTKEQIIRDLLNTFELEGHDLSTYFASIADMVVRNQGKGNLDPEGVFSALHTITLLHICPEIITDVPNFPQWIKRRIQQFRANHLAFFIARFMTPERAGLFFEWKQMYTTLVWVISEDEEFTSLFEQYTEIPYQDDEEALV